MYNNVKEVRLNSVPIPITRTVNRTEYFVDVACFDNCTNSTVLISHTVSDDIIKAINEAHKIARKYNVLVIRG